MYLHLTKEKLKLADGAKYIGAPPLRDSHDTAALWEGLRNGAIDVVGSDHAPFTLEDKLDPSVDLRAARQGVSDLETSLPMLFSRGVVEGRLSINRFVALTSSVPAQIFGIAHKKGAIHKGKDADIVIWNPKAKKVIQAKYMFSKSGYSVYENTEITGLPETSILRGAIVMQDFKVTAITGSGEWVKAL
jgi:dihydropyrimidinase